MAHNWTFHISIKFLQYLLIIDWAIFTCVVSSSSSTQTLSSPLSVIALEGSPSSYAQFRKWYTTTIGTLSFEFKTSESNVLLLYTDDGGVSDFFELKLVDGIIRLRFNLGSGSAILSIARNLADSQWHFIQIIRNNDDTTLKVDEESQNRIVRGNEFQFGSYHNNSQLFMGGIPSSFFDQLNQLSLPSVYFEPHLKGSIRNVMFASDENGFIKRQDPEESFGIREKQIDSCEHHDPCQHSGVCISTDNGPICDCRGLDYDGTFCEKEKPPSEGTFRGSEFLSYNFHSGEPIVSSSDEISLYFKTRQPNGLLFYSGDGHGDYLNLAVRDGGIVLTVKLGSGTMEKFVRPSRVRFDDNQWHKVLVHRKVREFSITVDGVYTERGSTAGAFTLLSSSVLYICGSDHTERLPGSRVQNNFIGCLRKIEFLADSLRFDILELARNSTKLIKHHGNLPFMCQEVEAADPVTFTTRDSFLELPNWESARAGSLSLKIRSNEPNGILAYSRGAANGAGLSSDFFAFELLDGHVYLLLNLGSGSVKVKATTKRVDDGNWHTVSLRRTGRSGRVTVDDFAVDFITPGTSNQLDLEGPLFLGGVGTQSSQHVKSHHDLPPELWSGSLRYGYVGCIRDLVVNGGAIDIAAFARRQDSGSIRPACHTAPPQCDSQPCLNGGACLEGWNRFTCDCSHTSFNGPVCAKDAATLSFNGEQYITVNLEEESHTQAEYIQMRFRTMRPNGLLLTSASNDKSMSHMTISLESSRAKVSVNLGEGTKTVHIGQSLNDDQWHTLKIERRGPSIEVKLDRETQISEITGQLLTLHISSIHIGALIHEKLHADQSQTIGYYYYHGTKDIPNFVGLIQNFVMNGIYYFDMARDGQITNFKVTAKFGKKDRIVHHPVTFKSKYTFIGLPQLKAYSTMNLYFQFKTLESDGIIMYNSGKGQDFIAVELVNGHLNYVFNLGDGPRKVRSNTRTTLNDNRWHAVTIGRPLIRQHTLMVDDMLTTVTSTGSNVHLDLDGLLYLGGLRRNMYDSLPKMVQSNHGFEGCIASLDFNGETLDPSGSDALIPSTLVARGCAGPVTKCSQSACSNRGICVQMWNSYACDCDMTSYSGPTCADGNESTAYQFGAKNGLITFTFPIDKRPDTKNDLLALGFITTIENAVLVRIDSGSSNDYMELEIVDGNLLMVYNLGTEDHDIGELSVKVNDGNYHIVRFTRSGQNSTIQVDNHNIMTKTPNGRQLTIFNSHSKVQIGGKKNTVRETIEKPFHGIISGFVFNGHRLLDMAAEDDPRISVEGHVELLMTISGEHKNGNEKSIIPLNEHDSHKNSSIHTNLQMHQAKSPTGYDGDELIYSGEGSGCYNDDEECDDGIEENGSGDDIITPVYVSTVKPTTTESPRIRPSTAKSNSEPSQRECDDEDCLDGSGSGEPYSPPPVVPTVRVYDYYTTKRPQPTWTPPAPPALPPTPITSPPEATINYPIATVPPDYDSEFKVTVRPLTTPPPWSRPIYRAPTRPYTPVQPVQSKEERPEVYNVPGMPDLPKVAKEPPKQTTKYTKSTTSEKTAIIIGIIAIALIAVVIIAPIVLFIRVKYQIGGTYKMEERKNFQFAPVSGTPPLLGPGAGQTHLLNGGASRTSPTEHHKPLLKMPKKKDLKEWYV